MIDDIAEIAAEAAGELAIAVGGVAAKEERERRKKKKFSIVAPIIGIILILGIIYLQFWRFGMLKEFSLVIDEVGYLGAIIGLTGGLILLLIAGLFMMFNKRQKEKNKPLKRIYFLLFISFFLTAMMVYFVYEEINFSEPLKAIPFITFVFGIIFMFIVLFDRMKERNLRGIVHFGNALLMRVTIPMMPVCIIFLGAMSGFYKYNSIFLMEVNKSLGTNGEIISGIIGESLYDVIAQIFNMGVSRPALWIFLSAAALLVLIYFALRTAFFAENWPYGCEDDPESKEEAQYFIDKAEDKFLSREDLNAFKRGKLRLNKTVLDKLEKKEKEGIEKYGRTK